MGTACKLRGSELRRDVACPGAQGSAAAAGRLKADPKVPHATWYTLTVFSTGPWADRLAALSEEEAVRAVLDQLDLMFSTMPMDEAAKGSVTPASDVFDAAFRYNWADHPTIRGGYRCAEWPPPTLRQAADGRVSSLRPRSSAQLPLGA